MAIKKAYVFGGAAVLVFACLIALRSTMTSAVVEMDSTPRSQESWAKFNVGDCVNENLDATRIADLYQVDCNTRHAYEVIAIKKPEDRLAFNAKTYESALANLCGPAFDDLFKGSSLESKYEVWGDYLEGTNLAAGDYSLICFADGPNTRMTTSIKTALAAAKK